MFKEHKFFYPYQLLNFIKEKNESFENYYKLYKDYNYSSQDNYFKLVIFLLGLKYNHLFIFKDDNKVIKKAMDLNYVFEQIKSQILFNENKIKSVKLIFNDNKQVWDIIYEFIKNTEYPPKNIKIKFSIKDENGQKFVCFNSEKE